MANLRDLLKAIEPTRVAGNTDVPIKSLHIDSREVTGGSLFIAQKGLTTDGHLFISGAIENGASAVLLEDWPESLEKGVTYIQVSDSRTATGLIGSEFHGRPSESLRLVGVTGTNGKTTVATLCYELMRGLGYKVGLFSTVEILLEDEKLEATHTTPDSIEMQEMLSRMVDRGCEYAFMEVSSHALDQRRTAGLRIAGAIFTNITHDHLDYHGNFRNYLEAKKRLFDGLEEEAFALVNRDDRHSNYLLQNCRAEKSGFGLRIPTDFKGKIIQNSLQGLKMRVDETEVDFRLAGEYNAYNLLAAYGAGVLLGFDKMEVLQALSAVKGPEGRLERVWGERREVAGIVDYAHSPDALEKVLDTLLDVDLKGGRIITVIGCGGDRDKSKRPKMAAIAAKKSAMVVLTSDNPRSEDPDAIIDQMMAGVEKDRREYVFRQTERKEGIRLACQLAKPGDIVLVAGKGHEKYQEIKGVKYPFDDKVILGDMLP